MPPFPFKWFLISFRHRLSAHLGRYCRDMDSDWGGWIVGNESRFNCNLAQAFSLTQIQARVDR